MSPYAAVAIAVAAATAVLCLLLALSYRRALRRTVAEHRRLYTRALASLDAATEATAAAEAEWRQSLDRIHRDYDDNLERLRIKQAASLARLQNRLPRPHTLRLHGDLRWAP